MRFFGRLQLEIAAVLFGVCAGFARLAVKDFRAYREKRRKQSL
jgi:hypothetical protein